MRYRNPSILTVAVAVLTVVFGSMELLARGGGGRGGGGGGRGGGGMSRGGGGEFLPTTERRRLGGGRFPDRRAVEWQFSGRRVVWVEWQFASTERRREHGASAAERWPGPIVAGSESTEYCSAAHARRQHGGIAFARRCAKARCSCGSTWRPRCRCSRSTSLRSRGEAACSSRSRCTSRSSATTSRIAAAPRPDDLNNFLGITAGVVAGGAIADAITTSPWEVVCAPRRRRQRRSPPRRASIGPLADRSSVPAGASARRDAIRNGSSGWIPATNRGTPGSRETGMW